MYDSTIVAGTNGVSRLVTVFEKSFIGGLITLIGGLFQGVGILGSKAHSGQTQTYAIVAFLGLAILLVIFVLIGGI